MSTKNSLHATHEVLSNVMFLALPRRVLSLYPRAGGYTGVREYGCARTTAGTLVADGGFGTT